MPDEFPDRGTQRQPGRCAQPCRLQYSLSCDAHKRNYLNLKDICTLSDVKALSESGAASLKIEGRLKSAAYVAGVTAAYRRALDYYQATGEEYRPAPEELEELALLFNRGGFSKGYIYGKTGDMILRGESQAFRDSGRLCTVIGRQTGAPEPNA